MKNNIPKGWIKIQLEEILVSLESGSRPKGGVRGISKGIPSIGGEHLNDNGGFNFTNIKYVPKEFAETMNRGQIQIGDILIVKDGATTGKTSFVNYDFPFKHAVVNEHVFICRASKEMNSKFLYFYLWSNEGNNRILENFKGSAQGGINTGFKSNTIIPLPPLLEQRSIVTKLDALMEKINCINQRIDKIPNLLKRFRQSVLADAVSGKLTEDWRGNNYFKNNFKVNAQYEINESFKNLHEIPLNWKWVALGNYVKCNRGRFSIRPRNDPRYFGGNIPFIQIGNLPREGGFITSHTQTLNEDGLKVSKMFSKNTLVIAIVGATIANTGILAYEMCFTDSMVGINKGDLILNLYIDYYLRIEKENLRQLSYAGGGQPNIKLELLNAYPIPIPPFEEQQEIVRRVQKLFAFADKVEDGYNKAKVMLDKLPQSILTKAFRGELVPQDEKDESARILLERIKEEKTKIAAIKKVKRTIDYLKV